MRTPYQNPLDELDGEQRFAAQRVIDQLATAMRAEYDRNPGDENALAVQAVGWRIQMFAYRGTVHPTGNPDWDQEAIAIVREIVANIQKGGA